MAEMMADLTVMLTGYWMVGYLENWMEEPSELWKVAPLEEWLVHHWVVKWDT